MMLLVSINLQHRYSLTVPQVEKQQIAPVVGRHWPREPHPHLGRDLGG